MNKIAAGLLSGVALMAAIGGALALDEPKAGWKDKRVRFVDYDPHNIVRVVVAMRSSFLVVFSRDEEIKDIGGGNTVAWEVAPSRNILFLKPRENHPTTNMQVVTARADGTTRIYQMQLSSVSGEQRDADAFLSLEYRYPSDEAAAARDAAHERAIEEEAGAASRRLAKDEARGPRNYAYTAQGSSAIEPAEVFDNGKITSFRFAGQQEAPSIYLVGADGAEQLVPKNTVGELTQVHVQGAKFVLRRGREVLCLYNENYDPKGLETGTKTTSPLVARVVVQPRLRARSAVRPSRDDWASGESARMRTADRVLGPSAVVAERDKSVAGPVPSAPAAREPMPQARAREVSGAIIGDTIVMRGGTSSGGPDGDAGGPVIGDRILTRGAGSPAAASEAGNVAQEIARENMGVKR